MPWTARRLDVPDVHEAHEVTDAASGLHALIVLHDVRLGPAVGGVRTASYRSTAAALADATALARWMTTKCALAGLDAGGGKAVVLDHPALDRARAFEVLGRFVSSLGGAFRTAGDLGTTEADLRAMAATCPWVHDDVGNLGAAVGTSVLRCAEAVAPWRGDAGPDASPLAGRTVAVQGCGTIGAAVAAAFARAGAVPHVADVDRARAERVARATGGRVVASADVLTQPADVLCPCAAGGVIDRATAARLRAHLLVPGANGAVADVDAERALVDRGVAVVPDVVSSAGAVVEGIGRTVMGLADRAPLLRALGDTAASLLDEARRTGALPSAVAADRARRRLDAAAPR